MKIIIQDVQVDIPYTCSPILLTIEIVHCVIIFLNILPYKGGLHSVLFRREIVTKKCICPPKIQIGQHVQGLVGGTNDI